MFSTQDNPFDTCSSFYENPSSNSFLMSFPTSLLNDEELLFEHMLHHQSPPSTTTNTIHASGLGSINPNSMNKEELGHVIAADTKNKNKSKSKTKVKTQAAPPPAEDGGGGGGKRKRVAVAKKQPGGGATPSTSRRRTGKKDRHSKIYTAQGPRDRRMRLSLQIARKFFDLQDMLGFDKASKTIEWLFTKSKPAIRDLTASVPPHQRKRSLMPSCASVTSTSSTACIDKGGDKKLINLEDVGGNVHHQKPSYSSPIAKESREKARARARQRTMEKNKQKEFMLNIISPNSNNVSKLGSSISTPETVDQEFNSMVFNSQTQQSFLENQMSSVSIIEKLLGSDSSASSSSIYDECSYLGFAGNWVTDSLRMYPNYGAISGVDELQVILQQQNPKCVSSSGSSGMNLQ